MTAASALPAVKALITKAAARPRLLLGEVSTR